MPRSMLTRCPCLSFPSRQCRSSRRCRAMFSRGCFGGVGRSGAARTNGHGRGRPPAAPRRHSVARMCCGGQAAPAGCSGAARGSGRGVAAHTGTQGRGRARDGPAGPGHSPAALGRRTAARARHRGRVEDAAVLEAAGATGGGGEGTGGAGHVRGGGLRL